MNAFNPVDQRMKLIDQYLLFWGSVGRPELIQHFDVSTATASRILKEYRSSYPVNMEFKVEKRKYVRGKEFCAAYEHDPDEALELFAYGCVKHKVNLGIFGPGEVPAFLAQLDTSCVANITRSILEQSDLLIAYASGSSGISARWVSPHAIFRSSGKWYFRAYCHKNKEFRSFIFGRVLKVTDCRKRTTQAKSKLDTQWTTPVNLTLAPHTRSLHPETLRIDLGLKDESVRNIRTTEALAGFVLNELRVDCSAGGNLDPNVYNLQLMNRKEVSGVSSMPLAPGFTSH